jgi:hypothetical protein
MITDLNYSEITTPESNEDALLNLIPDVKLVASRESNEHEDRVFLSAGITHGKHQYPDLPYIDSAFVPLPPWRELMLIEKDALFGKLEDIQPGRWVQVFEFPKSVYDAFAPLRESAAHAVTEADLNELRPLEHCKEAVKQAVLYCHSLCIPGTKPLSANIYFNLPKLPTTSNSVDPYLLGIHTDTACNAGLIQRRFSPNRICLNLGSETRALLFVNLGVEHMARILRQRGIDVSDKPKAPPLQHLRNTFMAMYPKYPVVKVLIRPGEGYIAPTDNVIHDGSSETMNTFDLPFHAMGHFMPAGDQNIYAMTTASN